MLEPVRSRSLSRLEWVAHRVTISNLRPIAGLGSYVLDLAETKAGVVAARLVVVVVHR